tara:strand:+ start:29750 stop:30469 length:720 start_codon:yes stop_codon:yes gene_type:complete
MAQCPNCSKPIAITDDNFGTLFRCEHCKAEFFIGFDGVPENSKEPLASDLTAEPTNEEPVIQPEEPIANQMLPPVEGGMSLDYGSPENDPYAQQQQDQPQSNDLFNIQGNQEQQPEMNAMPEMNSLPEEPLAEQIPRPTTNAFKNFADDVQNFGNDVSETGLLSFDIEISGIDLGETKRDLIEALEDKRFGWNIEDLTQNMKDGKLTISNVSAPKIIVLVKRITALGLVLSWRHHVSTQ